MLVSIGTETAKSIDILPLLFIKSLKKKKEKRGSNNRRGYKRTNVKLKNT